MTTSRRTGSWSSSTFVTLIMITAECVLQTANRGYRVKSQVSIYVNRYPWHELALNSWLLRCVGRVSDRSNEANAGSLRRS